MDSVFLLITSWIYKNNNYMGTSEGLSRRIPSLFIYMDT